MYRRHSQLALPPAAWFLRALAVIAFCAGPEFLPNVDAQAVFRAPTLPVAVTVARQVIDRGRFDTYQSQGNSPADLQSDSLPSGTFFSSAEEIGVPSQSSTGAISGLDSGALFLPPAAQQDDSATKFLDEGMTEADIDARLKELQSRVQGARPLTERMEMPQDDQAGDAGRETIRQRYPDGKTHVLREVVQDAAGNYYRDGKWRVFSREGKVIAEGQFARNQMTGQWRRFHNAGSGGLFSTAPFNQYKGRMLSVASFDKNQLDGMWTIYDQQNQKAFEVPYSTGQRNGTATWWYPSAAKMREATFRDGLLDGEVREWDAEGKLTRREEFIKGQRVVRNVSLYRPERPREEQFFLDAKLKLDGEDQWWEAKPAAFQSSGKRVQHGPIRRWYDNGQPKMEGQYQQDERVGKFTWWHVNGGRKLVGFYRAGQKTETWTWWHENGMKSIQGDYDQNIASGLWTWWNEEGQVKRQEDFDKRNRETEGSTGELKPPMNNGDATDSAAEASPIRSPEPVISNLDEDDDVPFRAPTRGKASAEASDEISIPLLLDEDELEEIDPLESTPGGLPLELPDGFLDEDR